MTEHGRHDWLNLDALVPNEVRDALREATERVEKIVPELDLICCLAHRAGVDYAQHLRAYPDLPANFAYDGSLAELSGYAALSDAIDKLDVLVSCAQGDGADIGNAHIPDWYNPQDFHRTPDAD